MVAIVTVESITGFLYFFDKVSMFHVVLLNCIVLCKLSNVNPKQQQSKPIKKLKDIVQKPQKCANLLMTRKLDSV